MPSQHSRGSSNANGNGSPARPSAHSSRQSSISQPATHAPSTPSALRNAQMPPPSPDVQRNPRHEAGGEFPGLGIDTNLSDTERTPLNPFNPTDPPASPSKGNNDYGSWGSWRPRFRRGYGSFATYDSTLSRDGLGGRYPQGVGDGAGGNADNMHGVLGDAATDGLLGSREGHKMSTTQWLAKRHGVRHPRLMYFLYYLPITNWIRQYRLRYIKGDLIAALTMASFYIPMSLSYAANLGHIPPINGLYSFVFNPIIYALLGTCPQMVVGPEAAGSLLTGSVVREAIKSGSHADLDGVKNAQIAGMVTGLAGAVILVAGLCRLGFLDSVLSRPFLRGFISAIGIVILVDQLIPEMGLDSFAAHSSASHGSSLDKIMFLVRHAAEAHGLTCAISFGAFAVVMVLRELKKRLQPRTPWVAYIPDRFCVVVLSAVLTWRYQWQDQGLDILGDIQAKGKPFQAHFPFDEHNFKHVNDAFSTAFLIALLGFFESSVAAKSLGTNAGKTVKVQTDDGKEVEEPEGIKNVHVSANRELVALGVANLIGGLFMALPAFGGYGRSKVNASTGGLTPMSSVFLSLITVICVLFLLPYFYYIPKGVLSAMISVVAYSLIEEAPHDLHYFWSISGYSELFLMTIIFLTTFFWNLRIGIAVGIGLSLLRLLRHSTRPRIQILGRVPGTNVFENAELVPDGVEFLPGVLIVKIPEPLTFANTGSLKDRLRRLEDHGTGAAHPALPKVRRVEHNRNVIFDVHGVTSLDPAASQVLLEIVEGYVRRGTRVFFCRVPGQKSEVWRLMSVSGIVETCGGEGRFLGSVEAALRRSEREESGIGLDEEEGLASGAMSPMSPRGDGVERADMLDGANTASESEGERDRKGRNGNGNGNVGSRPSH